MFIAEHVKMLFEPVSSTSHGRRIRCMQALGRSRSRLTFKQNQTGPEVIQLWHWTSQILLRTPNKVLYTRKTGAAKFWKRMFCDYETALRHVAHYLATFCYKRSCTILVFNLVTLPNKYLRYNQIGIPELQKDGRCCTNTPSSDAAFSE